MSTISFAVKNLLFILDKVLKRRIMIDNLFIQHAIFFLTGSLRSETIMFLSNIKIGSTDKEWKPSPHEDQIKLF